MKNLTVAFKERPIKNVYVFDVLAVTYDSGGRVFSAKVGAVVVNVDTGSYSSHGDFGDEGNGDILAKECVSIAQQLVRIYY